MSDKRAKYVGGSLTGVDLSIPYGDGDYVHVHVPHGGELPAKTPDGRTVPAKYRDSLLEQSDNWSVVNRATGTRRPRKQKPKSPPVEPVPPAVEGPVNSDTATADAKEGDE